MRTAWTCAGCRWPTNPHCGHATPAARPSASGAGTAMICPSAYGSPPTPPFHACLEDMTLMAEAKTAAPFGTVFSKMMSVARYVDGQWSTPELAPVAPLSLHPAAHVLHYGSECFEGMKAFRMPDGSARTFRIDRHVARFGKSAELLCLPLPGPDVLERMIRDTVEQAVADIPAPPGALYLRPTLIGTEANIGAAGRPSTEAMLYVLASPVGDYFSGGGRALKILIEEK